MPLLTKNKLSLNKMTDIIPGCAVNTTNVNSNVAASTSRSNNPTPSSTQSQDINTERKPLNIPCSQNPGTSSTTSTTIIKTTSTMATNNNTRDLVKIGGGKLVALEPNAIGDPKILNILNINNINNNNSPSAGLTTTNNLSQVNQSNINESSVDAFVFNSSRQTHHRPRLPHVNNGNNMIGRQRPRMKLSGHLGQSLRTMYSTVSIDVPPSYHDIPGTVPSYHGRSSGPPPSYDDVINPNAPPPTYQSLFGQVMEARKTSNGLLDLLRRLLIILISTLGCTIIIGFLILIPFSMIIVGAVYLDDCQIENIPAFLLIGGSVWAIKNIISCYSQCKHEPDYDFDTDNHPKNGRYGSLLNCFLFGWFIAGCIIVFKNYEPDYDDPSSIRYCNKTLYSYAFWLVTSTIVIFSLFVSCICCLMVSSVIASRQDGDDPS